MSKRLSELQRKHAIKVAELTALVNKSDDEEVSDEDKSTFSALKAELETLKDSIKLLQEVRAIEAEAAEPVDDEEKSGFSTFRRNGPAIVSRSAKVAPGIRAARFAMAHAIAKQNGSNLAGVRFAQSMLGDELVAKALSTTTQVDGGATIPQDFVAELVDLLRAKTVIRGNGATVLPMPMGQLTLPRLQNAATAQWQDELTAIASSQPQFDNIYFSAKKLTALVPVTNDLLRRSPLSVEGIIRDDMVKQIALAEDKAFLVGTGSSNQPSGIFTLTNASNLFSDTTASPTLSTVNGVLMGLEAKLTANNVDTGSAMWIFHAAVRSYLSTLTDSTGRYFFRDELEAGRLLGYPYAISNQLPTNLNTGGDTQIFFANMSDLIIGDTLSMRVDSSDVASYGTSSSYALDQTLFRCINEVDFNMKHGFSAAVATVRNWKPTGFTANAGNAFVTESAVTTGTSAKSAKP